MFGWFWHLLGLKSPKEMDEAHHAFLRESRRAELQLAQVIAEEGLTGDNRARAIARIVEAAQREGLEL